MRNKDTNIIKRGSEYTRAYENMRGVSFDGDQTGSRHGRFEFLQNMYVDYDSGAQCIESIPGFTRITTLNANIHGLFCHRISPEKEFIYVHAGNKLYRFNNVERSDFFFPSLIGTVADQKSQAFVFEDEFYFMDGVTIYKVKENKEIVALGEGDMTPYVPTLYKDGAVFEERNMLTDTFREEYTVKDLRDISRGTPELLYTITDEDKKLCAVSGISQDYRGAVYVPSYTVIGGEVYEVSEIADNAFYRNANIGALYTSNGLKALGSNAFRECALLTSVYLSSTVEYISDFCFYGCDSLTTVGFKRGLREFGIFCFTGCDNLPYLTYSGSSETLFKIKGYDGVPLAVRCNYSFTQVKAAIPVLSPVNEITRLTVDGEEMFYTYDPEQRKIYLTFSSVPRAQGAKVVIEGTLLPPESDGSENDLFSTKFAKVLSSTEAILGCTINKIFDGKIFLSGNPKLGGSVFYSPTKGDGSCSAVYFSSKSYFCDGDGEYAVSAMSTNGDTLAVFKSGDSGDGSIFYHSQRLGADGKKSYPAYYVHKNVNVIGGAHSLNGDLLFISNHGVCSLEKGSGDNYREYRCRSTNVNQRLLKEDLSRAAVTDWLGYLVVCVGGHIYLADSRDTYQRAGSYEYEWYYLSDIGSYNQDTEAYKFATHAPEGFDLHERTDEICHGQIYSVSDGAGGYISYFKQDGKRYVVYMSLEKTGGVFSPANHVLSCGDVLFFSTECGDICVFNNDRRGEAFKWTQRIPGFDPDDYEERMGNSLHPIFYSFADHSPTYALVTSFDDCGYPYLHKDTVPLSFVICCKSGAAGNMDCVISTDTGGYREAATYSCARFDFGEIDFTNISFDTAERQSVTLGEREQNWTRKQIAISTNKFCSPLSVYSISYRYTIKGKIKK